MLNEGESHICPSTAQQSHLFTDRNALLISNMQSTELSQQTLDDSELKKIAKHFLSNTSESQEKRVVKHGTIMSRSAIHQKTTTETMKYASLTRIEEDVLSSLQPSCTEKLKKKRRLEDSNRELAKSNKSKGRNNIIGNKIVTSSTTQSNGCGDFFVDLEDGSVALDETLSRQVLQQTATFLTKLGPTDRRLLWDLREVAQGTRNAKDAFKSEATDEHIPRVLTEKGKRDLRVNNHKNTFVGAKPSVSLKKGSTFQKNDEISSELDTSSSSSEPSLASDSGDDMGDGQSDFDLGLRNENKETPSRLQPNQAQDGGRLFTEDSDMWSD
ncbi:unnamed protein product [Phytomonas sp. Hart1]|nr:unnamed protein product [Phytomonas sp. Hart1]|eukprot:CCW69212.1 unnamed protein product [Phytomonas sp. isolate Hart1]